MKRTAIILAGLAFMTPTVARAASTDAFALTVQAAHDYWHRAPVCGTPTLQTEATLQPGMDAGAVAWVDALGTPDCVIHILRSYWRDPRFVASEYPLVCRIITHEYGHLLGLPHYPEPHHMMSASIDPHVHDPFCDNATLYAGGHRWPWRDGSIVTHGLAVGFG